MRSRSEEVTDKPEDNILVDEVAASSDMENDPLELEAVNDGKEESSELITEVSLAEPESKAEDERTSFAVVIGSIPNTESDGSRIFELLSCVKESRVD